ncbi:hypothetical protein [Citrobacter sp. wls613]|uniref:hypothetical protein n=1 Tax=Citrobacter sp. wls613 TaxID=2576436 RepID=UPI0010CA73BA|nr:hypothetical protein [Citrobacter sp. wls613]TKV19170.1 hypothetical protein FDX01_15155 [Citrobacter sp. wls613]
MVAQKCREVTLLPILLRHIGGLGTFVILDGDYRLQPTIAETIPPILLVLSEMNEREIVGGPVHQQRISRALEGYLQKHRLKTCWEKIVNRVNG